MLLKKYITVGFSVFFVLLLVISLQIHAQHQDKFVFTQLKYEGKWDPYPETWQDILEFLVTTTSIKPVTKRRVVTIDDDLLFSSPYIVILGSERFPEFSDKQRSIIRKYLANGGLIFVEDSSGLRGSEFDASFRKEITRIFPEKKLEKLPADHPLYKSYYLLRKVGGRRLTNNYLEGIDIAERTALIYSQNDIIGAWAKDRFGNYLWECVPGGQDQRFEAQKLTLNLIMYIICGTYKSDAIHQPYIERKLRRK
ncbi:MAG: DUF4159 domain-containing protein [Endomicrobiales bacterium]|nr:DUF4159 domain-containing protein [Endomicrobiales bacterium]